MNFREIRLDTLGLGARMVSILRKLGATTVGELTTLSADELLATKCVSEGRISELRAALALFGLALKGEPGGAPAFPEPTDAAAFATFATFARSPSTHLAMPLWVLDLCPKTLGWLIARQVPTVLDLVNGTEDDLWLLALADDLPLDEALEHLDEVNVRLTVFGLALHPSRPVAATFRLPVLSPEALTTHRLDEFPLRAETVFRLRRAGLHTFGDLATAPDDVRAVFPSWPSGPRAQALGLLAAVERAVIASTGGSPAPSRAN